MSDVIRAAYSFVLDGQGIPASTSPQTIQIALQDATLPLGHAILLSCHQAFLKDYGALTVEEQRDSGLTLDDCPSPDSLLELPQRVSYNAVVGNIHLYLVQLLRYVANIDATSLGDIHPSLKELGVLGFSTGMIASTVIACADNIPRFISHATEAFRLAFYMGLRAQQYCNRALPDVQMADAASQSWTLVTFGSTRAEVQQAVDKYLSDKVCTSSDPTLGRFSHTSLEAVCA